MKFLIAGGAASLDPEPSRWGGHTWQTNYRYRGDLDLSDPAKTQATIDALVDDTREFDGVFCETGTAMVLAAEWERRGLAPRCVLSLQVHGREQLDLVQAWYRQNAQPDPWPRLAQAQWVSWLAPSARQAEFLATLVPRERIFPLRFCSTAFELMMHVGARFDAPPAASTASSGTVLFPGNGYRDWTAILRTAAALPELPCLAVGGSRQHLDKLLARWRLPWPANLRHLERVSLEEYVELLKAARVVVVPLLRGDGDGGHSTVVLAYRLGVPVVCTDSPTLADYTAPAQSCLVAPTEDADALAAAVRQALEEPLRQQLVEGGRNFERGLDAAFTQALHAAIARAAAHRP